MNRTQVEAIRDARRAGLSLRQIRATLEELGLDVSLAAIAKATADVVAPSVQRREGKRAEVVKAFRAGESYRDIAERLEVSTATVGKWAKEAGAPSRPRGPKANPARAQLVELYRTGAFKCKDLAERFGVSPATVTNWTRGIETKGPLRGRPRKGAA